MKHMLSYPSRANRNWLFYTCLILINLISLGCKNESSNGAKEFSDQINAADEIDNATNKALVLKMYEEFDNGRLKDFKQNISSDFKCNVLGNTDLDWSGFVQFGNEFLTAFPDGKHNFDYIVASGENVVTIGSYTGTHMGEMHGIAPTNAKIALRVMHIDRVINGKIVEHRGIANQVQFMNQLGFEMVPKK